MFKNTLIIAFYQLIVTFPAPIILALALHIIIEMTGLKVHAAPLPMPLFYIHRFLVGIVMQCSIWNIGIVNTIWNSWVWNRVDFFHGQGILLPPYICLVRCMADNRFFRYYIYRSTGQCGSSLVEAHP